MKNSSIMLFLMIGQLFSCANLLTDRTFLKEMDDDSDSWFVPGKDFSVIPGDSGKAFRTNKEIKNRTPASAVSKKKWETENSLSQELEEKEGKLSDIQYKKYKDSSEYLNSDSEKIYYLNLPLADRLDYMTSKRRVDRTNSISEGGYQFYDTKRDFERSINLGMRKDDIVKLWGHPSQIEVAGNPRYENEKWVFMERSGIKQVFFEGGVVSGWLLK